MPFVPNAFRYNAEESTFPGTSISDGDIVDLGLGVLPQPCDDSFDYVVLATIQFDTNATAGSESVSVQLVETGGVSPVALSPTLSVASTTHEVTLIGHGGGTLGRDMSGIGVLFAKTPTTGFAVHVQGFQGVVLGPMEDVAPVTP